jgi:iron complex transport system substrate-binding protein
MALDPDLIVTKGELADAICVRPGLERLRACTTPGHVLTVPSGLIEDPGPAMLDAAELLFAKAYPDAARPR